MPTLNTLIDAYLASREFDKATVGRVAFWSKAFGSKELNAITDDDVDAALVRLAERGKLIPGSQGRTVRAGKPLSGASINRYITQLGSLFRYAKRHRLLPRSFVPPTAGVEKYPETPDPERYFRPEEVARLLRVARLLDTRYGKMVALITTAYHTGLRVGDLMTLCWRDVDLEAGTVRILRTKNGEPIVSPLSRAAIAELKKLPGKQPDARVFGNRRGGPYQYRKLWQRICDDAGPTIVKIDVAFTMLRSLAFRPDLSLDFPGSAKLLRSLSSL